jgi:acetyl-CoA carboxylase carboxyl transferase subunit alpha
VITEPAGGAHRDPKATADRLQAWILDRLRELTRINPDMLVRQRYEKFRAMGAFSRKMPG